MANQYDWQDDKGKVVTTTSYNTPPDLPGAWRRLYVFSLGSVDGAGGSPARSARRS